jgi:probable addiction module antidote protein
MKPRLKSYHEYLIEKLRDPGEREAYLNAALEDGDPKTLLKALRNVAEATGGMRKLASKTNLSRESLYRMLSERGNPELRSLGRVLSSFGLSLRVAAHRPAAHAH